MAWKPYNPFVSASALNLFGSCRRCFYLARRLKIARPEQKTLALQNVIDGLMKREFDAFRERGQAHPLMRDLPGDLVPLADPRMDRWRIYDAGGLKTTHPDTGLTLFALIDDLWLSRADSSLRVVDYKTHGPDTPFDLHSGWGPNYRRQLEFYAYVLLHSDEVAMPISSSSHLVVVKPDRAANDFGGVLRFNAEVLTHECDLSWIDGELAAIVACLESDEMPAPAADCRFCTYVGERSHLDRGEGGER